VKPSKENAAEENREYMIPRTFKKYCSKEYQLKKIKPLDQPRLITAYVVTPLRPTFAIYDQGGAIVAEFHPGGYAQCKNETFRPIFERMVDEIEESAKKTIRNYK
jgi:hypothetical protein